MLRGRGRLFSKSLPLPLSPFKGMWALPHAVFVGSAHTWFFAGSAHTRFFVGAAHTRTRNFLKKVSCVSSKTLKLWIGLDYSIHCRAGACSRRKNKQNLDCLKMRTVGDASPYSVWWNSKPRPALSSSSKPRQILRYARE